jgi:hypothetical protein
MPASNLPTRILQAPRVAWLLADFRNEPFRCGESGKIAKDFSVAGNTLSVVAVFRAAIRTFFLVSVPQGRVLIISDNLADPTRSSKPAPGAAGTRRSKTHERKNQ